MRDLTKLPNKLDARKALVRAVIETPKGRRGKYDYDPKSGLFRLKTLLPDGLSFPLDFGFIPSTLCDDGDPQDIMVLVDEPNPVGALIEARLIGVLEAEEVENGKRERNDRLLAVAAVSHLYAKIDEAKDLEPTFLDNLTQFWVNKGDLEGKTFRPLGFKGPQEAIKLVKQASAALEKA
ncbi:MAG: inorganic diphosphatase [Solirubrobacterales bacterium]|nr:inorganic diphosphatase [Solirubrobacterales bacterium]